MKKEIKIKLIKRLQHGIIICIGYYFVYNLLFKDHFSVIEAIEFTIVFECMDILFYFIKKLIHIKIKQVEMNYDKE